MRTRDSLPLDLEASPGVLDRGRNQARGSPLLVIVEPPLHADDVGVRRVGESLQHLSTGRDLGRPVQGQRALYGLGRHRPAFSRCIPFRRPFITDQHVRARVVTDPLCLGRDVDSGQPLHTVAGHPPRYQSPQRSAMIGREIDPVHLVGENRIGIQRLGDGHGSVELHIVRPCEEDIHRVSTDAGSCQYLTKWHPRPGRASYTTRAPGAASSGPPQHAPEEASPVPGALQVRNDGTARHFLQFCQGQLEWSWNRIALDAQSERDRIEDWRSRGVVANEKQFVGREQPLEAAQRSLEVGGMKDEGSRVFYPGALTSGWRRSPARRFVRCVTRCAAGLPRCLTNLTGVQNCDGSPGKEQTNKPAPAQTVATTVLPQF